jgi:hypothetical protein
VISLEKNRPPGFVDMTSPGRRAMVKIHPSSPQYPGLCEAIKTADSADYKWIGGQLWVSLGLLGPVRMAPGGRC